MRIITRLNIGGPTIHALLLTRELSPHYRTLLVAGTCEPEDGDMSYLLEENDRVEWVPELSRSVRPWRNLKALWRLWRLLQREKPAIVHTHTAMAGCLGRMAAILAGTPVIVHTFHGNSLKEYFSRRQTLLFRAIETLLGYFTDTACVVCSQQARELSGDFHVAPARKFRVVPLGFDLKDCLALWPPVGDGPLTVGWFGRMVSIKNIHLLCDTIQATLESSSNIRFVIAGDGPDRSILHCLCDRYGDRVEWLGWREDILPAMARCDVLLQTSRNEGTPAALIQGMAAARPFVSTAVGGVVDMVSGGVLLEENGARWFSNGVLAEASPAALSGVLTTLAGDRDTVLRMGLAGRALAANRYRKEQLVKNIDGLYRELLNRRKQA